MLVWLMGLAMAAYVAASASASLPPHAQELLTESMSWLDVYYDESAGYLYDCSSAAALRHDTLTSVWYSLGLLARNQQDDAKRAERIIDNVVDLQYTAKSEQWYGDFRKEPGEPYINSSAYPATIYGTWDPNWRGFISTTFIIAMEEFPQLLSCHTKSRILQALKLIAIGDSYRVGGVDDDNLYPSYSNPAIMRAFSTGWTGRKIGDSNMTSAGEEYAGEILELFNKGNVLSEFNSGTYTGISLFGLILWSKYLPSDSIMTKNGPRMIRYTWETITQLWHAEMKNMAGPWDRAYGFDMNRYFSLMGAWFWILMGKEKSSIISRPQVMSHSRDLAWGPLFAVLAKKHLDLIPKDVIPKLKTFPGEHTFTASTSYPPYDLAPRNITTWLSKELTIGAETFHENVIGGPARNQLTFNPAVVQWNTGDEISWISLYATENQLTSAVKPNELDLLYPNGTAASIFSFGVGTMKRKNTVQSWADLVGLSVEVTGNVDMNYNLTFSGAYGGAGKPINDFEHWNFTYSMPEGFTGIPHINLKLHVT